MTPQQQKAKELVDEMYKVHSNSASEIIMYFAKQCALIAVEAIIKEWEYCIVNWSNQREDKLKYWQQVKQEIEKL